MIKGKDGKHQTVEVSTQGNGAPVNAQVQEMPADNVQQSTVQNGNMQTQTRHTPPQTSNIPPQNRNVPPQSHNMPPQGVNAPTPVQRVSPDMQANYGGGQMQQRSPDPPQRNPHRVSRDLENPVSPIDPRANNFSYPSRSTLREQDTDTIASKPSGRLDNLKAAAIGLHVSYIMSTGRSYTHLY